MGAWTGVEIRNLKMYFSKSGKELKAVDDVSFTVNKNEFFGLVGESGCGKSTLARCLINLNHPTSGEIYCVDGAAKSLETLSMQMVFQNPFSSLNPRKTIRRTLMEVLKVHKMEEGKEKESIAQMLNFVGLSDEALNKYPSQFSGGQLQRIAIARALLLKPEFIIADEPVSALDVSVQAQILNLLLDLKESMELTMVFISHNLSVVEFICDRIGVMYLGKIVEIADVQSLYHHTAHPYTKSLIAAIPLAQMGKEEEFYNSVLEGELADPMNIPKGCRFASRCRYKTKLCEVQEPELCEIEEGSGHFAACHRIGEI